MRNFTFFKTLPRVAFVFLLNLFFTNWSFGQTVQGYYVTNSGDTVTSQIKKPKEINLGLKEIIIIDSTDNEVLFTPSQIKCFGYTQKNSDHLFFSKLTLDSSALFIEAIVTGKNTNVCYYEVKDIVRPVGDPTGPFIRKEQSYINIYLFEIKGRGTYFLSVNSITRSSDLESVKSKLKYFYGSRSEIMKLISERFRSRTAIKGDIKSLAESTNQM